MLGPTDLNLCNSEWLADASQGGASKATADNMNLRMAFDPRPE